MSYSPTTDSDYRISNSRQFHAKTFTELISFQAPSEKGRVKFNHEKLNRRLTGNMGISQSLELKYHHAKLFNSTMIQRASLYT